MNIYNWILAAALPLPDLVNTTHRIAALPLPCIHHCVHLMFVQVRL